MWRNVGVMLFIFALPVMQVILFCLAIGRDPTGLKLAVANMEMNGTVSLESYHSLTSGGNVLFFDIRNATSKKAATLVDCPAVT